MARNPRIKKSKNPSAAPTELRKGKQENKWQVKAEENLAGWKRALADLENYKKDQSKIASRQAKMAAEDIIIELIPVMDNFDHAFNALCPDERYSEWIKGFEHIRDQLKKLLAEHGVTRIPTMGKKFNPDLHEAVKEAKGHPGMIVREYLAGYKLHDKVIRAAKVKVGVEKKKKDVKKC